MEEIKETKGEPFVEKKLLEEVLAAYGFSSAITNTKQYIGYVEEDWLKFVIGVLLQNGSYLIVKLFREDGGAEKERLKIENQSRFSEILRSKGIKTPKRYHRESYATEWVCHGLSCIVTVEDWCGQEITEINTEIAYHIGVLMARIHQIALECQFKIGCGTLFCAAYENDVNAYDDFCTICENEHLDQELVSGIKRHHEEKMARLRAVWDTLPKAATQGDVSINNLVWQDRTLTVFDYNNAGDEVLISDLVLEGLLTEYEMDLPESTPQAYRKQLFPALLRGYLSVRALTEAECAVAWDIYTLYNSLWFRKIVYKDDSLEKLVAAEKYGEANELLTQMLMEITEPDDGRFRRSA